MLLLVLVAFNGLAQQKKELNIIPYPSSLNLGSGEFKITVKTVIDVSSSILAEADFLNGLIRNGIGSKLKLGTAENNVIKIRINTVLAVEEYQLHVSTNRILLSAGSNAGVFLGMQTLRQLLADKIEVGGGQLAFLAVPVISITDKPVFAYRGMHLDVSRHFFSIAYLRKYIDMLAMYKFNKLHLHLTDDQGWRIEIKKYPKLTAEGAWRTFNNQDSACIAKSKDNPDMALDPRNSIEKDGKKLYGGFYTQAEMKDLVKYAQSKHVEIIPEIDMPGHMMAAIKSYPFLSCTGGTTWGKLFTTPICPCKEETYQFAQNVFKEIFEIFPSKYVHIGGDEVDRTSWETAGSCSELMKREGITTSGGLQSYFINRMERFFNANGKKLIGWDEILEEGISATAMVMYWRAWVPDAPLKALKNGNSIIMTPGNPLYFDSPPDKNSLRNVYNFKVIPPNFPKGKENYIVGAQANLWSEMIPSENRLEYLAFPRAIALAENLWSHNRLNFESFNARLKKHYPRLDLLTIHYRLPDLENVVTERAFVTKDTLFFEKPMKNMILRFTENGLRPNVNSRELINPLRITENKLIKLGVFWKGDTTLREIHEINFKRQDLAIATVEKRLEPNLAAYYFKDLRRTEADKEVVTHADSVFYTDNISVPSTITAPAFEVNFKGFIAVPDDGVYTFYLNCDDGGILKIANRLVVDNGGMHAPIEKNGQIALKKGAHPFSLYFVEGGGGYTLKLSYAVGNAPAKPIPSSWLKH